MSKMYERNNDLRMKRAEDAFMQDDYEGALKLYTGLMVDYGQYEDPELYYKRGLTLHKLNRKSEALVDITKAILVCEKTKATTLLAKLYYRKGLILIDDERYLPAFKALKKAEQNGSKVSNLSKLLQTCEEKCPQVAELKQEKKDEKKDETKVEKKGEKKEEKKIEKVEEKKVEPKPAAPVKFVIPEKIRHEWYQTDDSVIVSIFIKKADPAKVSVDFSEKEFTLNIKQETGSDFQFTIDPLLHDIVPSESKFEVLGSKIELNLKKATSGTKWLELEGKDEVISSITKKEAAATSYPSSSKNAKNWDALAREVEADSKDEEQDANALFQKIYKDADDDTRRAMMKSYIESNGTSLSTNWSEVGKGKVKTYVSDDFEAKEWEK